MPLDLESLLRGVLAPALVSGLVLLVGWRPWRASGPDGRWSGGPAIGLGYFAASALLVGPPAAPFGERLLAAQDWIAWTALVGGLLLALELRLGRARALLGLALMVMMLTGVLRAMTQHRWEGAQEERWQLGLVLAVLLVWSSTASLARRRPGAGLTLALVVADTALALVAGLTHSVSLAQLAGGLCAALGAALVLGWWRGRVGLAGGGIALWALLHAGLVMTAHFYSGMPALEALLIGFAPLAAWSAELPLLARRPAWQVALARAALVAIPAGVAVVRQVLVFESDPYANY